MDNNTSVDIIELKEIANNIHKLKDDMKNEGRPLRRPIVIEFCGSPKSGKTSCINALNIFLKRNDFKTKILTERAGVCPIRSKQNPIFNIWTSTSSINELNTLIDSNRMVRGGDGEVDVIICDRGVFDALCWFKWLCKNDNMTAQEYNTMVDFVLLDRWRKNIDLVYTFVASPEESINREYANLLVTKAEVGSIMNPEVLEEYLSALKEIETEFGVKFRNIKNIDTTKKTQNQVGYEVTKGVLEVLYDMLMEQVGCFNSDDVKLETGVSTDPKIYNAIGTNLKFIPRKQVDSDSSLVEPIPIAVITNSKRDKVLCIRKTKESISKESPEKDKDLFYAGGHIRIEDKTNIQSDSFLEIAKSTLSRELNEELGLSKNVVGDPITIYTPTTLKSKGHLAICWLIEVDDNFKFILDPYEMVQKKGKSKSGKFIPINSINNTDYDIEPWSQEILSHFFNKEIKADSSEQLFLI